MDRLAKKNTKTKPIIKESFSTIWIPQFEINYHYYDQRFQTHTDKTQNEKAKQLQFQFDFTGDAEEP